MEWLLQVLIILCGCISFHGLYFLLRWKILPGKVKELSSSKPNQNHPGYEVAIVSEKIVGLYMSTVSGSSGLFILWETHQDVLYSKSSLVLLATCYIYWYFIHDIVAMYETFRLSRLNVAVHQSSLQQLIDFLKYKKLFIFHHLVFIILALPFAQGRMTNNIGYGLIGYLFIMEWSTLFISLHFILEHTSYKDTLFQQINGILFLVIFFIVRILSLPYMYWVYAQQHFNGDLIKAISSMYWFCHGAMVGTLVLQSIWFIAIVNKVLHGARRVYNKINIK